jgi:hypothetical protein
MSLIAFQLALADLATSPDLCARVARDPEEALAGRDLTPLERRRIASAAGQPGVAVNRALYRYNRTIPLTGVLRGTCFLLGPELSALSDEFWAEGGLDRNQRREAERFVGFLRRAMARGQVRSPYLAEVMEFELARYQVATRPREPLLAAVDEAAERWPDGPLALHPLMRVASFTHEPNALMGLVAARRQPPYPGLPEGEFHLLLTFHDGTFRQEMLDPAWAGVILDVTLRRGAPDPDAVARLVRDGLLVRTAPGGVFAEAPERETAAAAV